MSKNKLHQNLKRGSINSFAYLNAIIFCAVLACFGTLFFVLPHPELSDFEKRSLCPLPEFSINNLFKGSYIDSLDLFFADNFPFRDYFVEVSFDLSERRGFRSEKTGFNRTIVVTDTIPDNIHLPEIEITGIITEETPITVKKTKPDQGLLIYNGMALQFFGGNNITARSYAAMVNEYDTVLRGTAQVYCLVIPTNSEFYLPEEYRKKSESEEENINEIYHNINPGIISIDVCAELHRHDSEYIYFNTDHHWTGLGAYYAYTVFCGKAGFIPVPLDRMESKVSDIILGSLYWLTRDSRLKEIKDSVIYHKIPGKYETYNFSGEYYDIIDTTTLYCENNDGSFNYLVYLGGDHPLIRVDTELKNERKALIIKNSYGNPFATYLVSHYEQLFIVDYRKYNGSVLRLVRENGVTDVVMMTSVFAANTRWHVERIKKILFGNENKEQWLKGFDTIPDIFPGDTNKNEIPDTLTDELRDTLKNEIPDIMKGTTFDSLKILPDK